MPIYEYECKACGGVQELMQKMDEPPPPHCAKCACGPLVKLMSRTGFILKGGGWYVTDFRGGSSKSTGGGAADKSSAGAAGDKGAEGDKADAPKKEAGGGSDSGSGSGSGGIKAEASGHTCASGCKHAM